MTEIQKYEIGTAVPEYVEKLNPVEGYDTGEAPPMPQVKIIQKSSREIDNGTAKPGDVWSDAHGGVIAEFDPKTKSLKSAILLVPCKQSLEWLHFEKTDPSKCHASELGPFWRTTNPDDPRVVAMREWEGEDQSWRIRTRHVLMALPVNHDSLAVEAGVFSFMGKGWAVGRKAFVLDGQRAIKRPLPTQVWRMDVSYNENDSKQAYYLPVLTFQGLGPADLYKSCTDTAVAFGELSPQLESPKVAAPAPALNPTNPEDDLPF